MAANLIYMSKTAWQSLLASIKTKAGYVGNLTASQAKTVVDNIQTGSGPVITNADYLFAYYARIVNTAPDPDLLACVKTPTTAKYMFAGSQNIYTADLSGIDFSNCADMSYFFSGCSNLRSFNFSNAGFKNGVNMASFFSSCNQLTACDLFNNSVKPGSVQSMFSSCGNLTSVDLSELDLSGLTNTSLTGMFSNCMNLESIDVSGLDTSRITTMSNMFYYCRKLKKLDLTNFTIKTNCNISQLASYCSDLEEVVFGPNAEMIGYGVSSYSVAPFYNDTNLATVRIKRATPPTLTNKNVLNTANGSTAIQHIYVPAASVEDYKTATNWSLYADIISADPEE